MMIFFMLTLFIYYNSKAQDYNVYKYSVGDFEFIYYGQGYSYLMPHTARSFINAFNSHKKIFNYKPNEKISVFIHDFNDNGSGGCFSLSFYFFVFFSKPFYNVF